MEAEDVELNETVDEDLDENQITFENYKKFFNNILFEENALKAKLPKDWKTHTSPEHREVVFFHFVRLPSADSTQKGTWGWNKQVRLNS